MKEENIEKVMQAARTIGDFLRLPMRAKLEAVLIRLGAEKDEVEGDLHDVTERLGFEPEEIYEGIFRLEEELERTVQRHDPGPA